MKGDDLILNILVVKLFNCFLKNGPFPASFSIIFVVSNKHYNFNNKKCEKISIQYTVLGIEPMTFGTWVSTITTRPGLPLTPNFFNSSLNNNCCFSFQHQKQFLLVFHLKQVLKVKLFCTTTAAAAAPKQTQYAKYHRRLQLTKSTVNLHTLSE